MTVTVALLQQGTFTTSTTTKTTATYTPTTTSGVLVLIVACDNNGSSGAVSLTSASNDNQGRAWTDVGNHNYSPSGTTASDGVSWRMWAHRTSATTPGTTTLNFSPATTRCVYQVWEVKGWPAASFGLSVLKTQATTASPSQSDNGGVVQDQVVFGMWAREGNQAVTADTDSTNGVTWSTAVDTISNSGTPATSIGLHTQYKVGTLTTTPTADVYNPTGTSSDGVCIAAMILPTGAGATTPVPPGTPTIGVVTANSVAISWTAGYEIWAVLDYVVEWSKAGANSWNVFSHPVSTTTSITVTGLTYGVPVEFRVSRKNSVSATSPVSATSASATPSGPTQEFKINQAINRAAVR